MMAFAAACLMSSISAGVGAGLPGARLLFGKSVWRRVSRAVGRFCGDRRCVWRVDERSLWFAG